MTTLRKAARQEHQLLVARSVRPSLWGSITCRHHGQHYHDSLPPVRRGGGARGSGPPRPRPGHERGAPSRRQAQRGEGGQSVTARTDRTPPFSQRRRSKLGSRLRATRPLARPRFTGFAGVRGSHLPCASYGSLTESPRLLKRALPRLDRIYPPGARQGLHPAPISGRWVWWDKFIWSYSVAGGEGPPRLFHNKPPRTALTPPSASWRRRRRLGTLRARHKKTTAPQWAFLPTA